ncbi:NAD(P)/FAD-dependent oxidoreductase [Lutimonas sp.]|uniref:NAD(P)/FAD-dependent oxidoreductase n=1 Tax=Lutimonas sp. TaxID=1872403 RepID=UPI003D9B1586
MNIPQIDLPRIVVIGCGFAGLKFCKKINGNNYQVVLIDQRNYHTFQPLLYQVASSGLEPDSVVYPIRKIFKGKKNFFFRLAKTTSIDAENKKVNTSIGEITYDKLIIATGASSNFFGMKDIEKFAMPMKDVIEALNLRSLIIQNFEEALNTSDLEERERLMNFVIVGAGPTGIEVAGSLAELKEHVLPNDYPDLDIRRMQINIIEADKRVLASMSEEASEKAEKYLKKRGIYVWLDTRVKSYNGAVAITEDKNFESRTLIWAAGIKGHFPEGISKEHIIQGNRICVNSYNRIDDLDEVYAIGDVAFIKSTRYPNGNAMLASVAEQQGKQLAKNFNRVSKGQKMLKFNYNDKGTMATIGRNHAVVDLPHFKVSGIIGWFIWMFVHLMLLVDFRNRMVVFMNWAWSYVNYDKGTRVIIRKFSRQKT